MPISQLFHSSLLPTKILNLNKYRIVPLNCVHVLSILKHKRKEGGPADASLLWTIKNYLYCRVITYNVVLQ